jgi:hypothetical protein
MSDELRRKIVIEHRLTHKLPWSHTIRFWIEADPTFGGVDRLTAMDSIAAAIKENPDLDTWSAEKAALVLLEAVPSANSVEVCDSRGTGCAVHRDWP